MLNTKSNKKILLFIMVIFVFLVLAADVLAQQGAGLIEEQTGSVEIIETSNKTTAEAKLAVESVAAPIGTLETAIAPAPSDAKLETNISGVSSKEVEIANVTSQAAISRPIAVMIENEPPARPQSGLYAAKVLFEVQAEEVTRFMAIYYDLAESFEIGPIRSARHYFVDISTMFDAAYVHVGGSPMGLAEIAERKINNINAIKGDRGFYRTNDRRIPHNLYAKLPNLKKEMERKKYKTETNKKFPFEFYPAAKTSEEFIAAGISGKKISKIHIPYSRGYRVSYELGSGDNRFTRLYNDKPFKDCRNSNVVGADNVVIMRCSMHMIDEQMRHEMDLYEGGTCEIAIGGHFFTGSWDRDRTSGAFKFFDANLNDVKFNPGNIIIHIIPPKQQVIVDGETHAYQQGDKGKSKKSKNGEEADE